MRTALSKLCRDLRAFPRARGGNVAITFAITAIPIICAVGAAVDYSHANSVKADLQASLDATALMLSKEAATDTDSQLQANALKYFLADFNRPEAKNISIKATYSSADSTVLVNGSVDVPTNIMQLVNYNNFTITGSSTAKWGIEQLRVALVLDNTGSMQQAGKMDALKTATKSMLTMLQSASVTAGDIQVALIPFANGVNVGTDNVSETWLDWSYYTASGGWHGGGGHGGYGGYHSSYGGWSGGSSGWSSGSGNWNGSNPNSSGTWHGSGGTSCTWSTCWSSSGTWSGSSSGTNTSHWQGCVMDRDQDYDVDNTAPTVSNKSTLFPAIYNPTCPAPVMGLSYDWTELNAAVDQMSPTGSTNQTIGLDWGWLALTQGGPFDNAAMPADGERAIVLLTDGLNTENRWSTDQATIDARTQKVCSNIKAAGITLYTIQVNTGGDPTSTLLQNCASDPGKFYLLTKADQIVSTFNDIGSQLAKLRIAK
jgi:Flp pilus assembly protein TadG